MIMTSSICRVKQGVFTLNFLLIVFFVQNSFGQTTTQIQTLNASDAASGDRFGTVVDIYEDVFVVSAISNNDGAIYFYERGSNSWSFDKSDFYSSTASFPNLGIALAVYDRYAAAGFDNNSSNNPGVRIFDQFNDWNDIQDIEISSNDGSITRLDINDEWLAVGMPDVTSDAGGGNQGEVLLYQIDGNGDWNHLQTLEGGSFSDNYGVDVALYNDFLVVGAYGAGSQGEVYFYYYNQDASLFELLDTVTPGESSGRWGEAVDLYDTTLVVGDWQDDEVFVYRFEESDSTWTFSEKITGSDSYGYELSLDPNYLVIGSRLTERDVDVYELEDEGSYTLNRSLENSGATSGDDFGSTVSIWNGEIIVGAPRNNSNRGEAYYYEADASIDNFIPDITTFSISGEPATSASSIDYDITFSEDVLGLELADFSVVGLSGDADASGLSLVSSSFTEYTLIISGITGLGRLIIQFEDADGDLVDASGNGTSQVFYSDIHSVNTSTTSFVLEDTLKLIEKVVSPLGAVTANFGYSIDALDGEIAVGARSFDGEGTIVKIYDDGGSLETSSSFAIFGLSGGESIGHEVARGPGRYIAGSWENGAFTDEGAVYIWEDGSTLPDQTINLTSTQNFQRFSSPLATFDSLLAIGVSTNVSVSDQAVYLYKLDDDGEYVSEATINPDYAYGEIDLNNDYLVVGASGADVGTQNIGAVQIFKNAMGVWSLDTALLPIFDDGVLFGSAVALDDSTLVVGAQGDAVGEGGGSAYFYELDSHGIWNMISYVYSDSLSAGDVFGSDIAVSGDFAIVGAFGTDIVGSSSGAAYLYKRTDEKWFEVSQITPESPASLDYFGFSVAMEDSLVVIGAYQDDEAGGSNSGAVYVYEIGKLANAWIGGTTGLEDDWATASNWSQGSVPTASDQVEIPITTNDPVITTDEEVLDLSIESGATLTVNSGASLAIYGTASVDGTYTVKRNATGNAGLSIVSSPISDAEIADLAADYAYDFDGTSFGNASGSMNPGEGYFIGYDASSPEISLTGTPNTGEITRAVTVENFELIGNPYAAPISIAEFLTDNSSVIAGTVYFWNDGGSNVAGNRGGDYVTANALGSVSSEEPEGVSDGVAGAQMSGAADVGVIPSFQGVFVEAVATNDVTFSQDMQAVSSGTNSDANFYRQAPTPTIKLSLSGEGFYDELLIGFIEDATPQRDLQYDARKLTSEVSKGFYSLIGEERFAIQGLPWGPVPTIQLESRGMLGQGDLLVELNNLPITHSVQLLDTKNGEKHHLENGESINLDLEQLSTFELHFIEGVLELEEVTTPLSVFGGMNGITVLYPSSKGQENVKIYTLDGRTIYEQKVNFSGSEAIIHPLLSPNQLYVLQINDQKIKFLLNQ